MRSVLGVRGGALGQGETGIVVTGDKAHQGPTPVPRPRPPPLLRRHMASNRPQFSGAHPAAWMQPDAQMVAAKCVSVFLARGGGIWIDSSVIGVLPPKGGVIRQTLGTIKKKKTQPVPISAFISIVSFLV